MTDQPHYPYADGDFAILGPEVFASADGQTISWQGANYSRHPGEIHCMCGGIGVTHDLRGGAQPPPEALSARQSAPQAPDGPTDGQDAHDGTEGASCCSDPTCTCVQVNAAGRCGCARWYDAPLPIRYRNWRGETSDRAILPIRVWYGATEWHPEPQWLLRAVDVDKDAERDFAIADMQGDRTTPDNAATSSDTTDNPLREQLARVIEFADEHSCQMQDGVDYRALADAVTDVRDRDRRVLADEVTRLSAITGQLRALAGRWQATVRPGEQHPAAAAILGIIDGNGPTVAEATADDRVWPLQREGE